MAFTPEEIDAIDAFETPLSPDEESRFQKWKAINAPKDSGQDYDLRGAFKAGLTPAENGHWPDTYKKPNHPTFSDESIYAPLAPERAGHWQGETFVPVKTKTQAPRSLARSYSPQEIDALEVERPTEVAPLKVPSVNEQLAVQRSPMERAAKDFWSEQSRQPPKTPEPEPIPVSGVEIKNIRDRVRRVHALDITPENTRQSKLAELTDDYLDFAAAPQTFWGGIQKVLSGEGGAEKIMPFFGAFASVKQKALRNELLGKIKNKETLNEDETLALQAMVLAARRSGQPEKFLEKVAGITATSLPYAMEFGMTGGAYTATRTAVGAALKTAPGVIKAVVPRLAGVGVQTAISSPPRIAAQYLDRIAPQWNVDTNTLAITIDDKQEDKNWAAELAKSAGSAYIENLSERTGATIGRIIPKEAIVKLFRLGAIRTWMKNTGSQSVREAANAAKRAMAFNGVPEEIAEEYVSAGLQSLTGVDDQHNVLKSLSNGDVPGALANFVKSLPISETPAMAVSFGLIPAGQKLLEVAGSTFEGEETPRGQARPLSPKDIDAIKIKGPVAEAGGDQAIGVPKTRPRVPGQVPQPAGAGGAEAVPPPAQTGAPAKTMTKDESAELSALKAKDLTDDGLTKAEEKRYFELYSKETKSKRSSKTAKHVGLLQEAGVVVPDDFLHPSDGVENHVTGFTRDSNGLIQLRVETHTTDSMSPKLITVKPGDTLTHGMNDTVAGTTRYAESNPTSAPAETVNKRRGSQISVEAMERGRRVQIDDPESLSQLSPAERKAINPDGTVTIHRAVVKGVTTLEPGDFVVLDKDQAGTYVSPGMEIITQTVPAKDVAYVFDAKGPWPIRYSPGGVLSTRQAKANQKSQFTAEAILSRPVGSTDFKDIAKIPDAELVTLSRSKVEGTTYSFQRDAIRWGAQQSKDVIPELQKLAKDSQAKTLAALEKNDTSAASAEGMRATWYRGAIEGAQRKGPTYDDLVRRGEINAEEPTPAQKDAGNYPKEHIKFQGLDISIENKAGSIRRGKDKGGNAWEVTMPTDYGYIKRTEGKDGDNVDVYVGPNPNARPVFVIDQVNPDTKQFDEHKVMLGFRNFGEASAAYEAAFSDGRGLDRMGSVTSMTVESFKQWLKKGDTSKPANQQPVTPPTKLSPEAKFVVLQSGRRVDLPKLKPITGRVSASKRIKELDLWLWSTAANDAIATKNEHVHTLITGMKPEALSPADRDVLNQYLFGEAEGINLQTGQPAGQPPVDPIHKLLMAGEGEMNASQKAREIQRLAKERGITVKQMQEEIEAATVKLADEIARHPTYTPDQKFGSILGLYNRQAIMSARTSTSVAEQAYSTPAPLAYAMSYAAGVTPETSAYDPTGGNGMLLIGSNLAESAANEINPGRVKALQTFLGPKNVVSHDATKYVPSAQFQTVLANPPFDSMDNVNYNGYGIKRLEHLIALKALESMAPNGTAGIILGANLKESEKQHKGAQWVFENYLYAVYNVVANFEVAGELYSRQGTKWPVRVIIINGKRAVPLNGALAPNKVERLTTWEQVWAQAKAIRDGIERQRLSVVPDGAAGLPVRPLGATGTAEEPGTVPPAPGQPPQPAGGAGQPAGTRPGQPQAGGGTAAGEPGVPAERPAGRPGLPDTTVVQPSVGGGAAPSVEGVVPGSPEAAAGPGKGTAGTGGPTQPGLVPRPADVDRPASDLTGLTDAELDSLLDETQQQPKPAKIAPAPAEKPAVPRKRHPSIRPPKAAKKPTAPAPAKTRTAADIAAEAVKQGVAGANAALKGLHELFGGGEHMGALGPTFDEKTYAKAKPLFREAYDRFKGAGKSLKEFFQFLFEKYGTAIREYLKRFVKDLQVEQQTQKPAPVPPPPKVATTEFQVPYQPRSKATPFGTLIPKSIADGVHGALDELQSRVGPVDKFVANRLNKEPEEVRQVFSAEQVDGVSLAIDQIETTGGGSLIIGDETGIGKGRQGAGVMAYGINGGKVVIFGTKDPKLFSDMYGDLKDINVQVKPFILGDPAKASIVDTEGNIIHRALGLKAQKKEMQRILANGLLESGYNAIFLTYSQVNARNERQLFLEQLAQNNPTIIVLDEAHDVAGDNETSMSAAFISGGRIMRGSGANLKVITVPGLLNAAGTKVGEGGVLYMSATFAKRPENMPVYFRTALSKAADSFDQIVDAMKRGGVALQQAVSEALSKSGQYIRRERDFTGVSYDTMPVQVTDEAALIEHVDQTTDVLSEIVRFSGELSDKVKAQGEASTAMTGEQIDMTDFAAMVHNQIGQLLLAAKADAVVEAAIEAKRRGEKPVIALMNTMESFLGHYAQDHGIKPGQTITLRWNELLKYALSRCLRVTTKLPNGDTEISTIDPDEYGMGAQYRAIQEAADSIESKFPISPIDYIIQKLNAAGVKMAELTGRESGLQYTDFENGVATYVRFKKANKNKVVNGFNFGTYNGMLLNASGSTGLSAHASEKVKDQRPRHMFVAQAALDINVFVQTLGRIKRTGMVFLGVDKNGNRYAAKYSHLILPLQAELRPAAMAAKKMKSLNANTTAEADNAIKIEAEDIFNRYGDAIVADYLDQNPELQSRLNLYVDTKEDGTPEVKRDIARKFTGRIALLPDADQLKAYNDILPAYRALIEHLKQIGEYRS